MPCGLFRGVRLLAAIACVAVVEAGGKHSNDKVQLTIDANSQVERVALHADADMAPSFKERGRGKMIRRESSWRGDGDDMPAAPWGDSVAAAAENTDDGSDLDSAAQSVADAAELHMDAARGGDDTQVNWKMETECCGTYACAVEGGDCCCKGEVRLGKQNPSGKVSHWTPWTAVDHWVSCHTSALGEPPSKEEHRYCECRGYCPVTCPPPQEHLTLVENINATTCAEDGVTYRPGDKCHLQCKSGFKPSSSALQCRTDRFAEKEHVWSPQTVTCEGVPCAAPTWIKDANTPACVEGSHIPHGSTCAPSCKKGFQASAPVLSCQLGMLTAADFFCEPLACGVTKNWVVNQHHDGPCKEGDLVRSGNKCHAQCKEGYVPTVNHLRCHQGDFTPAKFDCHEAPCAVPLGVEHANAATPCEEEYSVQTSSSIPSGRVCKPKCKIGYDASVSKLNCKMGVLTPASFNCAGQSCDAPTDIANGTTASCTEGDTIDHNFACTPQCAEGFEPSVPSLSCMAGALFPSAFTCEPAGCELPTTIQHAPENICPSGGKLASGDSCAPVCHHGFQPSHDVLSCSTGVLSPSDLSCVPGRCTSPTDIEGAEDVACEEGSTIKHSKSCTPKCKDGFTPTEDSLTCLRGAFRPQTFSCQQAACSVPTDIENAMQHPCSGFDTYSIPTGTSCTPHCRHHYLPSVTSLSCASGVLSPSTFECKRPSVCAAVTAAVGPLPVGRHGSIPCWEGSTIEHNQHCTAQCGDGETASEVSLKCLDGSFNGKFTCEANHVLGRQARCLAPLGIDYSQRRPCGTTVSFGDGESCTALCTHGFVPNVETLTCRSGTFHPPTFSCAIAEAAEGLHANLPQRANAEASSAPLEVAVQEPNGDTPIQSGQQGSKQVEDVPEDPTLEGNQVEDVPEDPTLEGNQVEDVPEEPTLEGNQVEDVPEQPTLEGNQDLWYGAVSK